MHNPKRAEHLSWRKLGDHTIILDSKINQEVHHVNSMGSFLWELIDGQRTINDIEKLILDEYDIDQKTAESDLSKFLNELEGLKLLESANE